MDMRTRIWGAALAALLPAALAAQTATLQPQKPAEVVAAPHSQVEPSDGARRIGAEEAVVAVAKGNAVLIDVRAKEAYDASHAKGAKSIPLGELLTRLSELPKDKLIITYCT
jgi:hypothetical protein